MIANLAYALGRRKGVFCSMILAASAGACVAQPGGDAGEGTGSASSDLVVPPIPLDTGDILAAMCSPATPHSKRTEAFWNNCSTAPNDKGQCVTGDNLESATGTPVGDSTRTRCLPCGPDTVKTCNQLGTCTCTYQPANKPVVAELEAGQFTSYARLSDGTVYGWGSTEGGAVPMPDPNVLTTGVRTILTGASQISAGDASGCAIVGPDDKVKCWGTLAQTFPTSVGWTTPTEIPGVDNAVQISQGMSHACVVNGNGQVLCWGSDDDGQLGDGVSGPGTARGEAAPVVGFPDGTRIKKVVAALRTTCALDAKGAVYCWGYNGPDGYLGIGTGTGSDPTPQRVGTDLVATDLQGGGDGTFCVDKAPTKERLCWGGNELGQATRQIGVAARAPVPQVNGADFGTIFKSGSLAACDFTAKGGLECWGSNAKNQLLLGDADMTKRVSVPAALSGLATATTDLAMGQSHMCQASGPFLKCWGNNDHAQAGYEAETGVDDWAKVHDVLFPMGKIDVGEAQTSTPAATDDGAYGYVWYDGGSAATHPAAQYGFNSADGENRVLTVSRGRYVVEMPGLGAPGGMVTVSAHASTAVRCKTVGWGPGANKVLDIEVRCHDATGAAANSRFVLSYYRPSTSLAGAYLVTNADQTGVSHTPRYAWSSGGGASSVQHLGTGRYKVVVTKATTSVDYGNLFVQAHGADASYCKPESWAPSGTSLVATVDCFDKAGAATDTAFALSYVAASIPSPYGEGAYVYTANGASASYQPDAHYQFNLAEFLNVAPKYTWATSTRSSAGVYTTTFPFVGSNAGVLGHAMAVGPSSDYCTVFSFGMKSGDAAIELRCFDKDGKPSDSPHVTRYLSTNVLVL